jgi:hypothetical protein
LKAHDAFISHKLTFREEVRTKAIDNLMGRIRKNRRRSILIAKSSANYTVEGNLCINIIHGESLYPKEGPHYRTYCSALLPDGKSTSAKTPYINRGYNAAWKSKHLKCDPIKLEYINAKDIIFTVMGVNS